MSRLILLDSGPLGLVTDPRESAETRRCNAWLFGLLAGGSVVLVPEIADYEVSRELLRARRPKGVKRLDELAERIGFLPVTTAVWRRAAELWAQARAGGKPTAPDDALEGACSWRPRPCSPRRMAMRSSSPRPTSPTSTVSWTPSSGRRSGCDPR